MDYNQNNQNAQYQPGYAPYQGQTAEPMISPQTQYAQQPYAQQPYAQQPYAQQPYAQQPYAQQPVAQQPYQQEQYAQQPYAANKVADVPEQSFEYAVRKGFIVKTYGILLSQLGMTCFFILLTFIPAIKQYVTSDLINRPIIIVFLIIFLVVTIVVCIVFSCCRETARSVPTNYILLFSFTLCMSFYCFLLCSFYDTSLVISAALLTFGATVGLTVYAARTKTDFTFCGAFLFAFLFILVLTGILFFWVHFSVLYLMLGVLVYSLYLIYDTQLIIGGKTFQYSVDDYCLAALNLYIDIIYMFIKILQILAIIQGKK
jgi:FtsH-binding integral membrane protein